jgi:hypothetical protein
MDPARIESILNRMASGETSATDAEWMREHLALQSIRQVVNSAGAVSAAQIEIGRWLRHKGIADGWNESQYAARLAAWAQVELADLLQLMTLPKIVIAGLFGPTVYTMAGAIELAATLTTNVLANTGAWEDCGIDLEREPAEYETKLVELLLPILGLADVLQIDVAQAVHNKLRAAR